MKDINHRRNTLKITSAEVSNFVVDTLIIAGYTQTLVNDVSNEFIALIFKNISLEHIITDKDVHSFMEVIKKYLSEEMVP